MQARPTAGDAPARTIVDRAAGRTAKKGADKGIDGVINFIDDNTGKPKRVIVQVKSGHVKSGDVRDLRGVIEREHAAMGIFVTLEPATRDMIAEAAGSRLLPLARVEPRLPAAPDRDGRRASGGRASPDAAGAGDVQAGGIRAGGSGSPGRVGFVRSDPSALRAVGV